MSAPQTIVSVCSGVRLDPRYDHTIFFGSPGAQQSYFAGKVRKTFSAYTFCRKSWPVEVDATMEEAKTWSYLFFRNGTGKTYYYFITNIEYKNPNTVTLTLELDVLQTYLFDFNLLECFVERTHTETDGIGEHTVDEGLEVGDLVDVEVKQTTLLNELAILLLTSFNPNSLSATPGVALGSMYDGVFSGLTVWAVDGAKWAEFSARMETLEGNGHTDGIAAMWMYPKECIELGGENTWDSSDTDLCKTVKGYRYTDKVWSYGTPPTTLNGYQPKNNKLFTYPYVSLYVSNNMGSSATYKFERFFPYGTGPRFVIHGAISPEGVVRLSPLNYNGYDAESENNPGVTYVENYEHGLELRGFPTCAWESDIYKMWLAQNQNQQNAAIDMGIATMVGGAAMGVASAALLNPIGASIGITTAVSGYNQAMNILNQRKDMATQPPQARGNFSGSVNVGSGHHNFTCYCKTVDNAHAQSIDNFFTMYGYKVNRVQVPVLKARPAFTYIKTVGCIVAGDLCTDDRVKIEQIFDRGITWWVNGDMIGSYSQSNIPQ